MITRLTALVTIGCLSMSCGGDAPIETKAAEQIPTDAVELDSAQLATIEVTLATVTALPPDTITLTGSITFEPERVSHVGPRTQGRIRRVDADIGTRVAAGDRLAVLDSPELGAAQATLVKARVSRDVASRNFERAERLFRDGIVSERRRLEIEAEFREREAELTAAEQTLSSLGAEPDSAASGLFVLRAPIAGEVVEKHATVGEVVGPESDLFIVGDLTHVWLLLDLYETDLRRVRSGGSVRITVDAYPDRTFNGRVAYVSSLVDSVSRTVKVRVEIPNTGQLLKPGMFARASLALTESGARLGIPGEAVQSLDQDKIVFIPVGAGRFRVHRLLVGEEHAGGWLELRQGLNLGDTVVAKGSFALKAHMLRATFGEEGE